jgi:hypothetical protein
MRVAGLNTVDVLGDLVENYNVTEFVPGHMSYRQAMPRLLREVGWAVESDEFTEIEDPDPENHKARQRELINEIEEARKQLEDQQSSKKKGILGFWRKSKLPDRKEWETYEEEKGREQAALEGAAVDENLSKDALEAKADGVLFDVEALQREVAELAAQGVMVKELPASTLPPMKINLRDSVGSMGSDFYSDKGKSPITNGNREATWSPAKEKEAKPNLESPPPEENRRSSWNPAVAAAAAASALGFGAKPAMDRASTQPLDLETSRVSDERPPIITSPTAPVLPPIHLEHNAWADEFDEDFGKEKEMTLTFE